MRGGEASVIPPEAVVAEPLRRLFVLQFGVLAGALLVYWLFDSSLTGLAVLLVAKTAADLVLAVLERLRAARITAAVDAGVRPAAAGAGSAPAAAGASGAADEPGPQAAAEALASSAQAIRYRYHDAICGLDAATSARVIASLRARVLRLGHGEPAARAWGARVCEGVLILSAKERETANVGSGLWKGIGMWAWILFRISGLVLAVYLFVHIWVISQGRVSGAETLDDFFAFFDKPFLVFLDSVLVAAVLYHALNGVRILLMDVGIGIHRHKAVFWVCMLVAALAVWGFAYKAIPLIF